MSSLYPVCKSITTEILIQKQKPKRFVKQTDLNPTEGCGGMCDLHHGSAATMYCYHVKMDQNH